MFLPRQTTPAPVPYEFPPVSPESHGQMILGVVGSFTTFACAVVILRLYVRTAILNTLGTDDYLMFVAMLCSLVAFVFIVIEVHLGVGEHFGNLHQLRNYADIMHYSYHHGWILVTGITCVKLSVGFFLLRLVQGKWYKRFIIAWMIFLVIFTLACVGTLIFQCLPVEAAWDFELRFRVHAKCYEIGIFTSIGLFNGAVNIFTDFAFATLPIPVILPLKINLRTKILLICILGLGYAACAAAIIKEYLLSSFFTNRDILFNNAFNVWNDVELNIGILAASLPTLRPLFASILDNKSLSTSNTHRTSKSNIRVIQNDSRGYRFGSEIASEREGAMGGLEKGERDGMSVSTCSIIKPPSPHSLGSAYAVKLNAPSRASSREEEISLGRQNSGASLGSSGMSKIQKLEEHAEEEGMAFVRRERERARSRGDRRKRDSKGEGILRTTEVRVER
ncbi:hypothetical protein HYALB_00008620 [Hymenoscyphus albidus]|uniref:Rhodopsin domain-containing protein n=1 Tax=Hymenoscyphus albidus TaxID=595503 RepID=A0A9N9LEE6_9HELO|nr:hypothetical protein HYALB_00008620 [Hymenoscyphus albidus]